MHTRSSRAFTRRSLGGIAAALALLPRRGDAFQADGTIRIGLMESQTGLYAAYGLPGVWGSQVALDEINAAGGVTVAGKKVQLAFVSAPDGYDDAGDPAQALALIKRLADDDKVLVIKGLSTSNAGEAVFNRLNDMDKQGNPIVVFSSAIGAPGLSKISPYGFRNTFSEVGVVAGVARAIQKRYDAKTAGFFIIKDNVYYQSLVDKAIVPALKTLNIEVTAMTDGLSGDRDLSRQVAAIKQFQPDIVYVMATTLAAINFMKEAKRRGLAPKVFVGGIAQLTAETLKSGADAMEGMVMAGSYDPQSPSVKAFADEYRRRHGQEISLFAVNAYEAMYLIKAAIEASGIKNTPDSLAEDRRMLRDALAGASIQSITGERLAFNADRETPKAGVLITIKSGQFTAWNAGS